MFASLSRDSIQQIMKKYYVVYHREKMKSDIYTTKKGAADATNISVDTLSRRLSKGMSYVNEKVIISVARDIIKSQSRSMASKNVWGRKVPWGIDTRKKKMFIIKHGHRMEREIPE